MMKSFLLIITVTYSMLFSIPASATIIKSGKFEVTLGNVSDWVEKRDIPNISNKKIDTPVRYRLVDRQARYEEKTNEIYRDHIAQALNLEGVRELSKLEVSFNPAFENMTLHRLEIQRNGVWQDRLNSARINVVNQEQELVNDLFYGLATAVIVISDLRVGDSVRYQYSIKGRNPVYGSSFSGQFSLGWAVAIDSAYLRLVYDPKPEVNIIAVQKFTYQKRNGKWGQEFNWSQKDTPKYHFEQDSPESYQWEPRVFISNMPNWKSVMDWASPHYKIDTSYSVELINFIKKLKAYDIPLKEKVSIAIQFIQQDIRYFGVEIGQNSHIPHHPSVVFERRYGDCKDKANLLNVILTELGVVSYPALVNTRQGDALDRLIPSAQSFNHVINYIELEGKKYWVDGTNSAQSFGLDSLSTPDFGYALVLSPDVTGLTKMKKDGGLYQDKVIVSHDYISPNYGEPVDLYITKRYLGKEADNMRHRLARAQRSQLEKNYLNHFAWIYSDISIASPLKVIDERKSKNEITLLQHYRLGDFWHEETNYYAFNIYANQVANFLHFPKVINRKTPFSGYPPTLVEQHVSVSLPAHIKFSVRQVPEVASNRILDYVSNELYLAGKFSRDHRLQLKTRVIERNQMKNYVKSLKIINQDLGYQSYIHAGKKQPVNPGVMYLEEMLGVGHE